MMTLSFYGQAATAMHFAEVSMYDLPDGTRLERCLQREGGYKWAARREGLCITRNGGVEEEPMPSGRDSAFLGRCRFDSAAEAYAAWESWASEPASSPHRTGAA